MRLYKAVITISAIGKPTPYMKKKYLFVFYVKFILFIICYYFSICSMTKLRIILFVIIGFHDISGSHFFYFIIIIFYSLHDITYSYAIFSYVHQNSSL